MSRKPTVFNLNHPDNVSEILNALDAKISRKMNRISEICKHDVIQLRYDRLAVIFLTGVVVYHSEQDLLGAIEDGSFTSFDELDTYDQNLVPSNKVPANLEDWLLEAVEYYRDFGFFQEVNHLSAINLIREISINPNRGNASLLFDEFPKLSSRQADLCLLSWDHQRVLWEDMECDIHPDNRVYLIKLNEWKNISRNAFLPERITETWQTRSGPIQIEFTLNGQNIQISLEYNDDWIDLNLITQINRLIYNTGFLFETCLTEDQSLFLVVLTSQEKERLVRERGIHFG
jgi:hypothetical protein